MKPFPRTLFQLLVALKLVSGPAPTFHELARSVPLPATPHSEDLLPQSMQPLDRVLRTDGTLNLTLGFSGSLDPRGWRMVSELGQPPRFVRADDSEPNIPDVAGDEF